MKVLIADNYDSFTYNLYHLFKLTGFCDIEVVYTDRINASDWQNADAIVLSPGPGIAKETPALLKFTNEIILKKPVIGVCLGYQALSIYFGADFINSGKIYHGHKSNIQIAEPISEVFAGIPNKCSIGRYHSWVMDKSCIPDELRVIAYDEDANVQAFEHRELPITGLQFHPESVITENGLQMITNWLNLYR